jgi:hypothetical protein
MKVAKVTQTKITPFKHGKLGSSWWFWFKCQHPKLSIRQAEGMEISKTQGLTSQSCESFYNNLQSLYNKYNYYAHHIWDPNEIKI